MGGSDRDAIVIALDMMGGSTRGRRKRWTEDEEMPSNGPHPEPVDAEPDMDSDDDDEY